MTRQPPPPRPAPVPLRRAGRPAARHPVARIAPVRSVLALGSALLAALALMAPAAAQEATLLDCDACHLAGDGDLATRLETARYPSIAGHPARYIARQLHGYRTGLREHRQMTRTAIALGDGAAAAARRYAASPVQPPPPDLDAPAVGAAGRSTGASTPESTQPSTWTSAPSSAEAAASAGAIAAANPSAAGGEVRPEGTVPALVAEGDWSRGIAPCASCHAGPHRARLSPPLRGQPEAYLSAELHAYADGRRRTDTMGRMRAYAARLDEAEIARLAAWYADAPPRATSEVAAASDPAAPTDASGPSAEAAQPQGERP